MAVHFDLGRMAQVKKNHDLWWQGKLGRPLTKVTITDAYQVERKAAAPVLSQENCNDFQWSADEMIEALDEELSQYEFLGDAYPFVNMDAFGPGVVAAMCGAKLDNSSGRVWVFPEEEKEIAVIHVKYDPDNIWTKRIKEIYRAGMKRWNGTVIMGLPDLGGVMDIAATFRGSENLLFDLYDEPEEVIRLNQEIHKAWYEAYADIASELKAQGAYTDWNGLLSTDPAYIIQCDFSYMIGNDMFKEFVLETLREDTKRLTNTIYHLDGIGELNHINDILALKDLNAVQWVYGDGKGKASDWLDVYQQIKAAGKLMMINCDPADYLKVLDVLHGEPYTIHYLKKTERDLAQILIDAR